MGSSRLIIACLLFLGQCFSGLAQQSLENDLHILLTAYDSGRFEYAIEHANNLLQNDEIKDNKAVQIKTYSILGLSMYKLVMDADSVVRILEKAYHNMTFVDDRYKPEVYWALAISYTVGGDYHFEHIKTHFSKSDSLLTLSLNEYKQQEDTIGIIKTLRGFAFVKSMDDDFISNLDYNLRAYDLAIQVDYPDMRGLITNIALLHNTAFRYEESIDLIQNWLDQVDSATINWRYANMFKVMARAHLELGDYRKAAGYYKRAISLVTDQRNKVIRLYTYQSLAKCYLKLGEFDSLAFWLEEANRYFDELETPRMKEYISLYQGYLDLERGNYLKAEKNADRHLKVSLENEWLDYVSENDQLRYELYKKWGKISLALTYYERHMAYVDSVRESSAIRVFEDYKIQLETADQRLNILQLERNIQEKNTRLIIIIVGSLMMLIIAIFIVHRYRASRRIAILKLENQEIENKKIKEELDRQEQQLSDFTISMMKKNQVISELDEQLSDAIKAKNGNLTQSLKKMQRHISMERNSEESWEQFLKYFGAVHSDFFEKLNKQFEGLSRKELKHCALIKMNMTLKESAGIFGISPESVKVARYRLRKKINIDEKISLYEYLSTI